MKKTFEQFVTEARARHGSDRFDYTHVSYTSTHAKTTFKCNIHDVTFQTSPAQHLTYKSGGCPMCMRVIKRAVHSHTASDFIEQATDTHGGRYDYSDVVYVNAHTKVSIRCPQHGLFMMTPNNHTSHRQGCPTCRRSRGESVVASILDKHQIQYTTQFRLSECRDKYTLPFDFWLPTYNILIEFQGEQHFKPANFSTCSVTNHRNFEAIVRRDQIKRQFCAQRGIPLLEIAYTDADIERTILNFVRSQS